MTHRLCHARRGPLRQGAGHRDCRRRQAPVHRRGRCVVRNAGALIIIVQDCPMTVCHNGQSAALLSSSGLVMYFSTLPAPSSSAPCILTILTHLRVCVKICILTHPRNSLAQTVAHKCVSRLHPPRFPSMSKVAALHVVEQKLHVVGSVCNWEKCLAGDRGNFTPQPPLRSP